MKKPNYRIVASSNETLLIQDCGPWDRYPTITNGAESVVLELAEQLNGRNLEYIDSEGERARLLVDGGKFAGFSAVTNESA